MPPHSALCKATIWAWGRDACGAGGNGTVAKEAGGAGGFGAVQVSVSMPALLLGWGQCAYKHTHVSVQSHSHGRCVCTAVPVCEHCVHLCETVCACGRRYQAAKPQQASPGAELSVWPEPHHGSSQPAMDCAPTPPRPFLSAHPEGWGAWRLAPKPAHPPCAATAIPPVPPVALGAPQSPWSCGAVPFPAGPGHSQAGRGRGWTSGHPRTWTAGGWDRRTWRRGDMQSGDARQRG